MQDAKAEAATASAGEERARVNPKRWPRCPVTGEPAVRRLQWVSARWLADLWRIAFRVDARPSFGDVERFGLWESPTGLVFFDPPRAGDETFYRAFYERFDLPAQFAKHGHKAEFELAAGLLARGERVLDVGCAAGPFRLAAPHVDYVGLEPFPPVGPTPDWMVVSDLEAHVRENEGAYDAVCAFQVLEHVEKPLEMVAQMARAVRPGGKVLIGVPHAPSATSRIPNNLINAAPHHLTWWTRSALQAVAERAGLVASEVLTAPWSRIDAIVYWVARMSPIRTGAKSFHHSWRWYASAFVSAAAGYAMWRLRGAPAAGVDEGASLLLVAERPA